MSLPRLNIEAELISTLQAHLKRVDVRMTSLEKTTDARAASIEGTIRSSVNKALGAAVALFIFSMVGVFGGTMYMVSLIAEKAGIDTAKAAESSTTVITTTSDAVSTTTDVLTGADASTVTSSETTTTLTPSGE